MKNKILLMVLCTHVCFGLQRKGNDGGGGILISAEFATAGREALQILAGADESIDIKNVLERIANVKVIPVEKLCYKEPTYGHEYCQDAHFDRAQNTVLFAYKNWDSFKCAEKLVLATHEYARAAELETEDYKISGRFLSQKFVTCKLDGKKYELECADKAVVAASRFVDLCRSLKNFAQRRNQEN